MTIASRGHSIVRSSLHASLPKIGRNVSRLKLNPNLTNHLSGQSDLNKPIDFMIYHELLGEGFISEDKIVFFFVTVI